MNLMQALRDYLAQYLPRQVREVPLCTCGEANHVRVVAFRADERPVMVVVPEGVQLTPEQFQEAAGCAAVQPLEASELDLIYVPSELGPARPFDNPFGTDVYLDQGMMLYRELVFCPRMFGGRPGECLRVPTREFVAQTHAILLPLAAELPCGADDWAV